MTKYKYFVSWYGVKRSKSLWGNCPVEITQPISSFEMLNAVADKIQEVHNLTNRPTILNYVLLATEECAT